jgi:APA family basic amino acid/polyamine antiporter
VLGNTDVGLNTQNLVSIAVVVFLSFVNVRGVKDGASVQNVFTFSKVAMVFGLIVLAFTVGRNAQAVAGNFGANFWRNVGFDTLHTVQVGDGGPKMLVGVVTILAVSQVGSLFSSDAWNNVTFAAGEVRHASRNLPLALALGSGAVILLYIVINIGYLLVLPLAGVADGSTLLGRGIQFASEDRVATAVAQQVFGPAGAQMMAAAILVSCFGAVNGMVLAGARVYYAMARDGLFFRGAGKVHPIYRTPARSLTMQCVWSCVLCLSGTYSQLLDFVIFAVLMFYIATIAGVFVLRITKPDEHRPYRALGYPVLPAIDIALACYVAITLLRYKPQYTWPGLTIVLMGIPVYYMFRRTSAEVPTTIV